MARRSGVKTSQMTRAVPRGPEPGCHGISAKVSMSGIRYWSDSAIRVNPSIDEPSNHVPCLTEPSSWWIGIVTALTWPMMSVNWSWMKRMPLDLAASILAVASGADSGRVATVNGTSWTMGRDGRGGARIRPAAVATGRDSVGRGGRYISL